MKFVYYIVLAVFLSQCASVKTENTKPFTVKSATYNSNTSELLVEFSSSKNINFQELFYNNQKAKADIISKENKNYVYGNFKKVLLHDLNLHSDAKQEFGNKTTTTSKEKIPFELKNNEAIVTYKINGTLKNFRIQPITILK